MHVNCCYHFVQVHNRETLESFCKQSIGIIELALALELHNYEHVQIIEMDRDITQVLVLHIHIHSIVQMLKLFDWCGRQF